MQTWTMHKDLDYISDLGDLCIYVCLGCASIFRNTDYDSIMQVAFEDCVELRELFAHISNYPSNALSAQATRVVSGGWGGGWFVAYILRPHITYKHALCNHHTQISMAIYKFYNIFINFSDGWALCLHVPNLCE